MEKRITYIRDGRAPIPDNELISKVMSSIKHKNTNPELILRKTLWNHGIKGYRLYWNKVPGKPDISFPGKKIAIFVNGCFWHRCPYCKLKIPKSHAKFWTEKFERNIIRDSLKMDMLTELNWRTIIVWECEIKKNLEKVVNKIFKIINE